MVHARHPYLRKRRGSKEFLWPFLLIIFVGIIIVLAIQLFCNFLDQREIELKNKIYLYLDQGTATILPWGATEWTKAYSGQLVLEGDRLGLGRSSRGVLTFYNGTVGRLDADSSLEINKIIAGDDSDQVNLTLQNGRIWLNMVESAEQNLNFVVETDNLRITSYRAIFEVELSDLENVRVTEGEVLVEVFEPDSDRKVVLEQVKVGVGQQVEITASDLEKMVARESISLLEAVDNEWEVSDWYVWNSSQDMDPTVYEVEESIPTTETTEITEEIPTTDVETPVETIEPVVENAVPVIAITFPTDNPYTLPTGETSVTIEGTASADTVSVTVTNYDENGVASAYTLQSYVAGATTWKYNAFYGYGNLREGRNRFMIVARNEEDLPSTSIELIVEVPEGAFTALEEEEVTETPVEDETTTIEVSPETVPTEETPIEPALNGVVGTPSVTLLNDESAPAAWPYTTSAAEVLIEGTVGLEAVAVYVNDFKLTKFVVGSGSWNYYAKLDFGNYKIGDNSYTVYAEDSDGNRSAAFTFSIYYEAP
ncbi:MAG: FecR domain-containing protein [Candidatus Gracilibacteria bacterium]